MQLEMTRPPAMSLSRENINIWNAMISHADEPIPLEDGAVFSFRSLAKPSTQGPFDQVLLDGNLFGYVNIEAFPFDSNYGVDLRVAEISDLPLELSSALREAMLLTVISEMPSELRTRLQTGQAIEADTLLLATGEKNLHWFECELVGTAGETTVFTFGAAADAICAQLDGNNPLTRKIHTALGDQVTNTAERLLGTAALNLTDLEQLDPGDCVLISDVVPDADRAVLVDCEVYIFEAEDDEWVCSRVEAIDQFILRNNVEGISMEDDAETVTGEHGETAVTELAPAQIKVNLSFSLGSDRVPLSEIQSWKSGALVCLPAEFDAKNVPVTVKVNGTAFAEGDLVQIDDRLAVRLNHVRPLSSPRTA